MLGAYGALGMLTRMQKSVLRRWKSFCAGLVSFVASFGRRQRQRVQRARAAFALWRQLRRGQPRTHSRDLPLVDQIRRAAARYSSHPTRKGLRAEFAELSASEYRELGASGVLRDQYGRPRYDGNPDLTPVKARGLGANHGQYHEMWLSDSAIFGIFGLFVRQILAGYYQVTDDPKASHEEKTLGDMCRAYFGFDGSQGWLEGGLEHLLAQMLLSRIYGFVSFEIVPEVLTWVDDDGMTRIVKVPGKVKLRHPSSVERWLWQGERLVGMTQRVQSGSGGWKHTNIPIDRLLLVINNAVDGNPEGISDLRSIWIPWIIKKDSLIRDQMAAEILYAGVTQLKEGGKDGEPYDSCSQEDREKLETAIYNLTHGTLTSMVVPYGWEIEQKHPEFDLKSNVDLYNWCNHQIFLGLSAILLGLDASHSGSKSLSDAAGALLYNSMEAAAEAMVRVINGVRGVDYTGLIKRIADWNFPAGTIKRYPKLEVVGFYPNLKDLADAMTKLEQFRFFTPTAKDERLLRRIAKLPDYTEEELQKLRDAWTPSQASQKGTQNPAKDAPKGQAEEVG